MNEEFSSLDGSIKKHQRESVTPYKLAVVIFIKIYCSEITNHVVFEKRDFCIATLKLIQSPDLSMKELFNLINSAEFVLARYSQLLLSHLEVIRAEGVKELLDLFDSLGDLMKPLMDNPHASFLNKHSVLGLYVRRIIVMFDKLSFCKVVELYDDLKAYIDENENDKNPLNQAKSYKNRKIWGGRQAELLVAQQAHALLTDEHKALPPRELHCLVKDLLSSSPYYAEAHYLSYLNFLRVNDYCGSVNSLYHCFDRLAPLESNPSSDDKLRTFRYAALNLTAYYAHFGYKQLANSALKEAIMLSQEAKDNVCLQLAHSWVYYLQDKNKGPLIDRSIAKATALGMSHTASLALIASAHDKAMRGEKPEIVFETLAKSDVLNYQHSMTDLMSMIYAEKTALWAYYGKTEMSAVCAQLLLLTNSGEKKQLMFNGPSTCQAVVTVANILHEMGEYNLASAVLSHAKERFPNRPSCRIWALGQNLHNFSRFMRDEKWTKAEEMANYIKDVDPIEGKFRKMEVLFAKNDFPEALKLAYELEDMKNDLTPQQNIRTMLWISQIKSGARYAGTPESATSSVLLLSSAITLAQKHHLSYYEALTYMHIANCQLLLRTPLQALKNVNLGIIKILAHGGVYDQARAHITYAKCLSANGARNTGEDKKAMIHEGIKHLHLARKILEKIEAKDKLKSTYYFLSTFYHEIDMHNERNKWAYEFKQLNQVFPMDRNHLFLF